MRVSIVVTNHNYAEYLPAAIDSALAQTHEDTEVIVVDDGSTDGSSEVIEGYTDRVQAVLQENGGQGSAVNAGWRAATGDALIFLDADDELKPSAAAQAARLLGSPEVAKAHWPLEVIDGAGHVVGGPWPSGELPDGDLTDRLAYSPDYLTPPQSGNAFARAALDSILPMPEADFVTGADTYLFLLATAYGSVRRHDEPLSRYRRHDSNNYSGQGFDERLARLRRWFDVSLDALAEHCSTRGLPADRAAWSRNAWVHRVSRAVDELDQIVPAGTQFILIDDGDWGMQPDARRRPVPFVERDGEWWGPPADDATAIAELERLRTDGAAFAVIAFAAFWWLDHYREFTEHLRSSFDEVAVTPEIRVFDLRATR